jgi:tRNA(Ile)-lysidine synthase
MDPADRIVKKVSRMIARHRMIAPGEGVLAAVSGGPDSVCLLDVLHRLQGDLGARLTVAHFDHGLRPEADADETRFVKELAASCGLEVVVKRADPPLDPNSPSLEEKARDLRYGFLQEVKAACGAHKVATGHTCNDQAETVLMRLLRGSGLEGLSGIRPVRQDGVIRPLLALTRDEVIAYLDHRRLAYATDASNFEPAYLRNRIRLHLLPHLEAYQPRIIEILARTAEIARGDNDWMDEQARAWIVTQGEVGPGGPILPVSALAALPEPFGNRVIRTALRMTAGGLRRIGRVHIEAIRRMAGSPRPQARAILPGGLLVRRTYNRLIFSKGDLPPTDSYCVFLEYPGIFYIETLGCALTMEETTPDQAPKDLHTDPWTAYIDADRVGFPLMLRNFRPGDRLIPLGMTGHKKVKDLFVDMKIPADLRTRIPILVQGTRVVWVCGLRMDDGFRITSSTTRVLKVTLGEAGLGLPRDLRPREG